jgi:uncharacterized caspase-like protein
VYFAGHGTENVGRNFLIPIDARLTRASELDLEAISLDTVLSPGPFWMSAITRLPIK